MLGRRFLPVLPACPERIARQPYPVRESRIAMTVGEKVRYATRTVAINRAGDGQREHAPMPGVLDTRFGGDRESGSAEAEVITGREELSLIHI